MRCIVGWKNFRNAVGISAATGEGVSNLLAELWHAICARRANFWN